MSPAPVEVDQPGVDYGLDRELDDDVAADRPWIVLVWNDPINLMSYVSFVFQKVAINTPIPINPTKAPAPFRIFPRK